jgi:excisionase family DNA binding protein
MTMRIKALEATDRPAEWLSPADLARELHVPRQTVYRWRMEGKGPGGHTIGRHVRYSRDSITEWLEKQADPQGAA